jgi:hypothetical protein
MRFSDWQLTRLRNALRAYHHHGRGSGGEFFNWKDVSEAISLATDVTVPPERLRQFVEGVKTPGGYRKFPVPQETSLQAILKFATEEENGLLSEDELREHMPSGQAALRMLEYLQHEYDIEQIPPPPVLEGTYRVGRIEEERFVVRELTLQRASDDGLIQLVQMEDTYDIRNGMLFDDLSPEERDKVRGSRVLYGGWAILTPEDNLLMFLKKERNGHNCYYLTVASQNWHALEAPVSALALLRHEYPMERDDGQALEPRNLPPIIEWMGGNTALFSRIT